MPSSSVLPSHRASIGANEPSSSLSTSTVISPVGARKSRISQDPPSVVASSTVVIEGFLLKQAKIRKTFVKRWVVLENDGTLYFSKLRQPGLLQRTKSLKHAMCSFLRSSPDGGSGKSNSNVDTDSWLDSGSSSASSSSSSFIAKPDQLQLPKIIQLNEYRLATYPNEFDSYVLVLESDMRSNYIFQAANATEWNNWKNAISPFVQRAFVTTNQELIPASLLSATSSTGGGASSGNGTRSRSSSLFLAGTDGSSVIVSGQEQELP
jgi:hypothetical protein